MNSMQPGQTYDIADAYVGMSDKVQTHVIVHRLTEKEQKNVYKINLFERKRKE